MRHLNGTRHGSLMLLALILLLMPLVAVARPQPVAAAGGVAQCTEAALRAALAGGGLVTFSCSGTIPLASQLEISQDTVIDGGGVVTLDGGGTTRLLLINQGVEVELRGLTLMNGNGNGGSGGAIFNEGDLTLVDSTVRNNSIDQHGGAILSAFLSTLTIIRSTLSDNVAGFGGAVGGSPSVVTILDSTLNGNSALNAGGAISVGISTLVVMNSRFIANSTPNSGGAISVGGNISVIASAFIGNHAEEGGAIYNVASPATITASTFSGNSATASGGVFSNHGDLTLTFNTLAGNSAGISGADIANVNAGPLFPVGVATLTANVLGGGVATCDGGNFSSGGYNVSDDSTCGLTAAGDLQNVNPLLGNLANNGGPTMTMLPLTGSPAIDRVPNALCTTLSAANDGRDQRGAPRPESSGAPCDSGSVELQVNSYFCVGERSGSLRYFVTPGGCVRGEYRLLPVASGSYDFCVGDRSGSMRYLPNSGASCLRGENKLLLPRVDPITICVGERSRTVRMIADGGSCLRGELAYQILNPVA